MQELKEGFYTALGTPLDEQGHVIADSLTRQIEQQITAGASGLLFLGSMGAQCSVRTSQCKVGAQIATQAVAGRVPLFVGVMDNGIQRVLERIADLEGLPIRGVVLTTPYYFVSDSDSIVSYFTKIAARSPFPVYLYDLPGVTKNKITLDIVQRSLKGPNIKGIKTNDFVLTRQLTLEPMHGVDFSVLFSGLDVFDEVWKCGIRRNLDGMFACTPKTTAKLYKALRENRTFDAACHLNQILGMRDLMARFGIFPSFTFLMNELGCAGDFAPDYMPKATQEAKTVLLQRLTELGEV